MYFKLDFPHYQPLTARAAQNPLTPLYPRIGGCTMTTTKNARATTAASTDGDALQFRCVTFSHLVRHQLNRIIRLPHMHTMPPKTLNPELAPNTVPSGADLSFVRHFCHRLTHNLITMNCLPLCLKKVEISGLVRHLSRSPQPTTPTQRMTHASLSSVI
jgi:hypothetical protein